MGALMEEEGEERSFRQVEHRARVGALRQFCVKHKLDYFETRDQLIIQKPEDATEVTVTGDLLEYLKRRMEEEARSKELQQDSCFIGEDEGKEKKEKTKVKRPGALGSFRSMLSKLVR